jgi:hypothetical protein
MPLPQKVIEQLGREPPETPGWSGQLIMFSGTVFLVAVLLYAGLAFGYGPYYDSALKKISDEKSAISRQISLERQNQLITFYSQLANLDKILKNHIVNSPVFYWLEKNTQKNIYFEQFSLNLTNNQLDLVGIGKSIEDINQQLAIIESLGDVEKMDVSSISNENGDWKFEMKLYFDSSFFKRFAVVTVSTSTAPNK